MDQQADIRSIQALGELEGALNHFTGEAQDVLQATVLEIRRTEEWLEERLRYWQRQVKVREGQVANARASLHACQSSGYRDARTGRSYIPDCRGQQETLLRAQVLVREAEAELRNVQNWIRLIQEHIAEYSRRAQQLATFLNQQLPKGKARLRQSIAILQSYTALTPSATRFAPVSSFRSTGNNSSPLLRGRWAEQGTQYVPLTQIDTSDSWVQSTNDFHKVPYDQMVVGFRMLNETIRPLVQQGADGEAFSQMDEEQGLDYANGYRRIYDAFYGESAIRLNQIGNRYEVVNGYHRLHVARELGLESVPASVVAQLDETDSPPLGPTTPPEIREGGRGGPERRG